MKTGSFGLTVPVLFCTLLLQGCLLDVTSVVAPNSVTTGKVIVITINGATMATGLSQKAGIVLQVPLGTTVLRVHHSHPSMQSQFLTATPSITAGYTAEDGYYLSGWVAQGSNDAGASVKVKVWLSVPDVVAPGDYRIKTAVGVYDAANTWVPQNPQTGGSPVTDFSQISGRHASDTITISPGAPDSTPPADVTPAVSGRISLNISGYNEAAQGDVTKYHVYVSKGTFNSVAGRQLLDGMTIPSVTGNGDNSLHFSSDIGTGLFYADIPPGAEYPIAISGLWGGEYYLAVTAVDVSGNESSPIVIPFLQGGISGTVTNGTTGIPNVSVRIHDANDNQISSVSTVFDGTYMVSGLPPGNYRVQFVCTGHPLFGGCAGGYLSEWYNDKPDITSADAVPVTTASTTPGINAVLAVGGRISGTVTNGTTAIQNVTVRVYDAGQTVIGSASTAADGTYTVIGLSAGNHKVQFDGGSTGYMTEWYNDKPDFTSADTVPVTIASTTPGINAALSVGGRISGAVMNGANITVRVYDSGQNLVGSTLTAMDGTYAVGGLRTGSYKLQFMCINLNVVGGCIGGYLSEWYNDKPDFTSADTVPVTAPNTTPGINASLAAGGGISGKVTPNGTTGIYGIAVKVYDGGQNFVGGSPTGGDGTFRVIGLPTGIYKVQFDGGSTGYVTEWYNDKPDFNGADAVPVTAGIVTVGIDAHLSQPSQSHYWLLAATYGSCLGSVSDPPHIDCGAACSYLYEAGTPVTLTAVADPFHPHYGAFTVWGGSCAGNGMTCDLLMDEGRTATAMFTCLPVRIAGLRGFSLIGDSYNVVSADATIQVQAGYFPENLTFSKDVSVTVRGGYDGGFGSQLGFTTVSGALTISGGTVAVEKLILW